MVTKREIAHDDQFLLLQSLLLSPCFQPLLFNYLVICRYFASFCFECNNVVCCRFLKTGKGLNKEGKHIVIQLTDPTLLMAQVK